MTIQRFSLFSLCFFILCSPWSNAAAIDRTGYVSSPQGLILRTNPDQKAKKIAVIPFANAVEIIEYIESKPIFLAGSYGVWQRVQWNEKTGWAFSGFIAFFSIESAKEKAAELCRHEASELGKNIPELSNDPNVAQLVQATVRDVKITSILANLVVVDYPFFNTEEGRVQRKAQLLRYDEGSAVFSAIGFENLRGNDRIELVHLNEGKEPDAIHIFEYSDILHLSFFIGEKPSDTPRRTLLASPYKIRSTGRCGKMAAAGRHYLNPDSGGEIETKVSVWKFNCQSDRFERSP